MAKHDIDAAKRAISGIESGGRYDVLGPMQKSGDQAIGRYQVMASNVPDWTDAAGLGRMSPTQFRHSPGAQEAVFEHRFGGYLDQYGPAGAAAAWFSGSPNTGSSASDSLGTTVPGYVKSFMAAYDGSDPGPQSDRPQTASARPDEPAQPFDDRDHSDDDRTAPEIEPDLEQRTPAWAQRQEQDTSPQLPAVAPLTPQQTAGLHPQNIPSLLDILKPKKKAAADPGAAAGILAQLMRM